MSYSQTELDALKKAYARGVKRVTYDGQTVEYDDAASLKERIATIEREMKAGTASARPRGGFAGFARGHN